MPTMVFFRKSRRKRLREDARVLKKRHKKRARTKTILFLIAIVGIACVVVYLFVWFMRQPAFLIKDVEAEGVSSVSILSVEDAVMKKLEGKVLSVFPANNVFLVSTGDIEKTLQYEFSEIKDVTVTKEKEDGKRFLRVDVMEYEPYAIWCDKDTSTRIENGAGGDGCMMINERGAAYSDALTISGAAIPVFYVEGKNLETNAFISEKSHEIILFIDAIEDALDVEVKEVQLKDNQDVVVLLKNGVGIRATTYRSLETQLADMLSVLDSNKTDLTWETLEEVAYVDLRFNNKALYKFNQEEEIRLDDPLLVR